MKASWRVLLPLAATVGLACLPAPDGLAQHAWYFFAVFAGAMFGLMLEPLPGAAIGLIALTFITVLSSYTLFSPAELAKPGFKAPQAALNWVLSGFSNSSVWLIFTAFMFALGYEKTGLGRRIALLLVKAMGRRTLLLGYAITLADAVLAPFTPSNTARSGGTIFPVIRSIPALYGSEPNDPSARKIGSYIMWTSISATCITSSMFLTGFAPNLLAVELVKKTSHIDVGWMQWFTSFAPVGILLLLVLPWLVYRLYPPGVKTGGAVQQWAGEELARMGAFSGREIRLALLVLIALTLWIFGGDFINPTTTALLVVSLMLATGIVSWEEMLAHREAWNVLAWFGTLVALADGLSKTGFVAWLAQSVTAHMSGLPPLGVMVVLTGFFFLTHYMFASVTAHATAMLPVTLVVGAAVPGLPLPEFAMLLLFSLGLMGILTPYATGPSPVYYGSGYLPAGDYWRLGAIFGAIFLAALLGLGTPYILAH